jgi:hypothetical protein
MDAQKGTFSVTLAVPGERASRTVVGVVHLTASVHRGLIDFMPA